MTTDIEIKMSDIEAYALENSLIGYLRYIPRGSGAVRLSVLTEIADGKGWCDQFDCAVHRLTGLAVVERSDGTRRWYLNGRLHREDGPAVERADGTRRWYLNGRLHREDGPAVERADGTREWYLNDRLHREDGR